ncbi:type VI secretion system baseplate subunit TssK [Noviherbaspirillum sp.]|uniref:type VI secretion system baseplate subunit TssK n=1 Tax=Noviherbaspirillum sp. TaxID=1926288 RepID=UPI002FDFFC56
MLKNKVVWSEGTFLQTQHFQQQERYLEGLLHHKTQHLHSYGWGFSELTLDRAALAHGQVRVTSASGVLPDGTVFDIPDQDAEPAPLELGTDIRNAVLYLALPLESESEPSVVLEPPARPSMHRFTAHVVELRDVNEGFTERVPVQLGRLNLRLLSGMLQEGGFAKLGVARVIERRADGQIVLDPGYIPPVLAVDAGMPLRSWLNELRGLVQQRSEVLSQRLSQPGRGGMGEVADFLLLMIVNRYGSLLAHLAGVPELHPERLYCLCLEMAGELSSFGNERRLTRSLPPYNHDDLALCFEPLILQLRLALSMVLEQTALQIELHDRKYGVRVAVINDKQLLSSSSFVLAVNASLPSDTIRARFPTQTKIGTIEKIRDLVNLQLQGIPLRPLPVVPRQIPYHAGFNYFEIDKGHELWRKMATSGGLAMHISGDFPDLELELWAIKGQS